MSRKAKRLFKVNKIKAIFKLAQNVINLNIKVNTLSWPLNINCYVELCMCKHRMFQIASTTYKGTRRKNRGLLSLNLFRHKD